MARRMMGKFISGFWFLVAVVFSGGELGAADRLARPPVALPGQRADGTVLLPNLWSLRPAGKQVVLGDFPVNIALHPSGRFAAVLHCGYGQHEIVMVELPGGRIAMRAHVNEAF